MSIPSLTYEDLKEFHATHYHPSNARFFTYGDLPLEPTLAKAQDLALCRFDPIDVSSLEVSDEVRLEQPKRVEVAVPAEAVVPDEKKQAVVSVAYLLVNQIKEPGAELDSFTLSVASDLLLSGPQAATPLPRLSSRASVPTIQAPLCCPGLLPRVPDRVRPRLRVRPGNGLRGVPQGDVICRGPEGRRG